MNSITKIAVAGGALLVSAAFLVSFANGKDDDKKKKYQIIHHSNGEMLTFDTIIPMSSSYTPQEFLADKGISDEDAKIITIPDLSEMNQDGKMMRAFVHEVDIEKDGNGAGETVEISVEMDENGNMKTKKLVNGVEVEMTEAELKEIKTKHGEHGKMIELRIDDEDLDGLEEQIEISVEIDDEGNKTITKIVNGEEVEMTEEELEDLEMMEIGGDNINVFLSNSEVDVEGLQLEIEKIIEEGGEDVQVITKRIEINSEDENVEWNSEDGKEKIEIVTMGDMEDHTVVLVTENYDKANPAHAKMMFESSSKEMDVYPNPNDGIFKLRFQSDEKQKTNITVTNSNGKKVFEENLGKFSGSYEKEIDLKKFGSGMYTITIQNGNNEKVQKVMVK